MIPNLDNVMHKMLYDLFSERNYIHRDLLGTNVYYILLTQM